MKLVELLAREWSEWPGNCDYAVCDSDGEIRAIGTGTNNDFYPADAVDLEDRLNGTALLVSDDGKRVIRTDWAAERARIAKPAKKADKDGWIRHRGGKCPVDKGVLVDVRFRNGDILEGVHALESNGSAHPYSWSAGIGFWKKDDVSADIMSYRLHKPAEQVEACSKPELMSLPENYGEIIGGSVEGPIQWRDRITEIDATTQALTAERADLVQKLAGEGFALIGRINDLLTEAAQKHEDMSDPKNWRNGDIVECIVDHEDYFTDGYRYVVDYMECDWVNIHADDEGDENAIRPHKVKFHSRPSA